jgi:hypothetical protein
MRKTKPFPVINGKYIPFGTIKAINGMIKSPTNTDTVRIFLNVFMEEL